jgi:hypothetical protein
MNSRIDNDYVFFHIRRARQLGKNPIQSALMSLCFRLESNKLSGVSERRRNEIRKKGDEHKDETAKNR